MGFRIPAPGELSIGESALASSPAAGEETVDVSAGGSSPSKGGRPSAVASAPVAVPAPSKERQIEFLCPNGHHLHGPASLQGRAGECPECGSRFRIPVVDQPEPAPELILQPQAADAEEIPLEEEVRLESPPPTGPAAGNLAEPLGFLEVLDSPAPSRAPACRSRCRVARHPWSSGRGRRRRLDCASAGRAVRRALGRADESSRVEVHLESGSVLLPDGYVKSHSMQDYAVLVSKDPDGSSTVTIVPWNTISRVILRALKQVPGEVVS